jgi:ribosomal protein L11 methyltransferase
MFMSPNSWLSLKLEVAQEYSEIAAHALHEFGCSGAQVDDTYLKDRGEDADFIPREKVLVTGYYEQSDGGQSNEDVEARLRSAPAEYSFEGKVEVEPLDTTDWSTSWRENFPPLEIGPFLIVPTWEEVVNNSKIQILLDPGLAFGTGQHPTTQMCLELLGERAYDLRDKSLLDVGCGSGVLSIAAAKLGASVVASDLDPHCTSASCENAELNGVAGKIKVVEAAGLDWCQEKFDFVIANLMSDLLIKLAPELARVSKTTLIVSGISAPRAADVAAALDAAGFKQLQKCELDGELRGDARERWTAFVFGT